MARTYARWKVDTWATDQDWRSLTVDEQWCYFMLCSQAKLSIAGVIDLKLSVWATYADGLTADALKGLVERLETLEMVVVDWDTEELAIRSFTRHDGSFDNRNSGRGVWSAIGSIASPKLRQVVVENLPDKAWETQFQPRYERPSNVDSKALRTSIGTAFEGRYEGQSNPRSPTEPESEADSPLKGGVQRGESFDSDVAAFLNEIPIEVM